MGLGSRAPVQAHRVTERGTRLGGWVQGNGTALALVGLTVVAFVTRIGGFGAGFYGDEAFTYDDVVGRSLADALGRVREYEDTPPFFFVVAWVAAKVGDPAVWLRMPSLVLGTALIPLAYLLGARIAGHRAALIGSGLLALSPFAVRFSSEARAYSLLAFLLVASTLALLSALEAPYRRGRWLLFCLLATLALYTHYTAFFVILAQAAWALFFNRSAWRPLLLTYGLVLVAVAPWMLTRPAGHGAAFAALYPFSLDSFFRFWAQSLVGSPQIGIHEIPGRLGWWLLAAMGLTTLAGLTWRARERVDRASPGIVLLAATALAAPLGVLAYTLAATSVVAGRNMYASAPFAFLLVGAVLGRFRPRLTIVAATLAAAALAVGLSIASRPAWQRPAWKEAARFVNDRAGPTEPVVLADPLGAPGGGDRDISLIPLSLYLDKRENVVGLYSGDRAGFSSLEPRRRVYTVVPYLIGGARMSAPNPGPDFTLESAERHEGLTRIGVFTFRRRLERADRARLIRRDGREVLVTPGEPSVAVDPKSGAGAIEAIGESESRLMALGWAVGKAGGRPAEAVFLFDRGRLLAWGRPTIRRRDLEPRYGRGPHRAGFRLECLTGRARQLVGERRVVAIAVSGRRAWRLPPVAGAFGRPTS